MISNIGKAQYRMMLEHIARKMKEGKVKPVKQIDNNGEFNEEHKSSREKKQNK